MRKIIALTISFLILSIVQGVSTFGEEGVVFMSHYKYGDFASYLELPQETEAIDTLYHTISVTNLQELNIDEHFLFENFPAYNVVREQPTNSDAHSRKYVVYDLLDESALFIFIEDGILTNVCRMMPRCTLEEFASVTQGLSSPDDVIGIDENAVFNPFIQWGPVSYHCLDDGTFRRITYMQSDFSSEKFVVKDIVTVSQSECLTILCYLDPDDMPSAR